MKRKFSVEGKAVMVQGIPEAVTDLAEGWRALRAILPGPSPSKPEDALNSSFSCQSDVTLTATTPELCLEFADNTLDGERFLPDLIAA